MTSDKEMKLYFLQGYLGDSSCCKKEKGKNEKRRTKLYASSLSLSQLESPLTHCGLPRLAPAARCGMRLTSRPGGLGRVG